MPMEIERLSREFIWWPADSHTSNLDEALGEIALIEVGVQPQESDWQTAEILPAEPERDHDWWVRLLVGPGGIIELPAGDWQAWTRIEANPERPVYRAGIVTVT